MPRTAVMHYRHRDSLKQLARQWYSYDLQRHHVPNVPPPRYQRPPVGKTLRFATVVPHVACSQAAGSRGFWVMICSLASRVTVESLRNGSGTLVRRGSRGSPNSEMDDTRTGSMMLFSV